jgi:hypothetical protein
VIGHGSRIKGQGSILRSLRALTARVDRFGQHRACTDEQLRWVNSLADDLDRAYRRASTAQAIASLTAVEQRASLTRKTSGRVFAADLMLESVWL